jgi:hypothetical protein
MREGQTQSGACFCGAVGFILTGAPIAAGYCHCQSCRHWLAAPLNAFTLWKPGALQVTKGAATIAQFGKTPKSLRQWCRRCGGHLYTEHPGLDVLHVYVAVLPQFTFAPSIHVYYEETVLRLRDGLPKYKDVPEQFGGSGVLLSE